VSSASQLPRTSSRLNPEHLLNGYDTLVYSDMDNFVEDGFQSKFCSRIGNHSAVWVNLTSCERVYFTNRFGTGNFVMTISMLHSTAARLGGLRVLVTCDDAEESAGQLVLPWLTGVDDYKVGFRNDGVTPKHKACRKLYNQMKSPVGERARALQYDLRRMAVGLLGCRGSCQEFAGQDEHVYGVTRHTPLFDIKDVQIDDAILHFRCGDLMNSEEPRYGFLKFASYANHLSPAVKSIGIATEPFGGAGQQRDADTDPIAQERCRIVVNAMKDYIQHRFPESVVQIRNSQKESVGLTYARMILANQTFVGLSTFGFFPAIACFGQALIRRPSRRNLGAWLLIAKEMIDSNIKFVDEDDWLPVAQVKLRWGEDGREILEWFRSNTT